MAQQIPVRPGVKPAFVGVKILFTHGQCDRTVGIAFFYALHQISDFFIRKPRILPALKHKGAQPQSIADPAAVHDLIRSQPVSGRLWVASAYAAVIAVVLTIIGKFHEATDKYPVPIAV